MNKKLLRNMDYKLIIIIAILIVIGCVALWSATKDVSGVSELNKQIMWAGIGFVIMIGVTFINYEFYEKIWFILYGIAILLLIAVLFTNPINGATSWFNLGFMQFQPSEVAKLFTIISLSAVITKINKKSDDEINKFKNLLLVGFLVMVPVVLIAMQPDYGTAMVFFVFTVLMLFISNISKKYIITALLAVVIIVPLLYVFVLPVHARNRIKVFLDPSLDPLGIGYNVTQSKLAIGSGTLTGMGIGEGNQTQLGYLSPKTTDFIYAVIAEEMGFIVAGPVIILFMLLILRCINISRSAKDNFGALIAIGITGMFIFYATENIGMTMGLLPITGVPLPFVSYGGSSMISNMVAIGILLNISGQRQKVILMG